MMAVLTENFGGKWPFWMSPRQAMVVPVGIPFNNYAREVADLLRKKGFCAEADTDDGNTMNKKVRNAQLAQFNFIFGKWIIEKLKLYLDCKMINFQWWARRKWRTAR